MILASTVAARLPQALIGLLFHASNGCLIGIAKNLGFAEIDLVLAKLLRCGADK
jgi:hypothetical protein